MPNPSNAPAPKPRRRDFSRTDWRRHDVGRLSVASGAKNARELAARHAILTQLYDAGQHEVLRQVKDGALSVRQLVDAARRGHLNRPDLAADLKLRAPLWATFESDVLPKMGRAASTRATYRTQALSVLRRGILGPGATFADLLRVDWPAHRAAYDSPAAWNHVRRTFSAALTHLLGDKWHPARRAFLRAFGGMDREVRREVRVTPAQLARFFAAVPDWLRPVVVTMAATGVRVGEAAGRGARAPRYDAETGLLRVSGKTGPRVVDVPAPFRAWAAAAFPAPLQKRALQQRITDAARAAGLAALRPNDLRHAAANMALAGGAPLNALRDLLGHTDIATTAIYTHAGNAAVAGAAVAHELTPAMRGLGAAPAAAGPVRSRGHALNRPTAARPSAESSTRAPRPTAQIRAARRGA